MAKRCAITGKFKQFGNRVSHANNRTRHSFKANLQKKRIYIPSRGKFVTLYITPRGLRTIDKLGVEKALKKLGIRGV
ncbi:MAG: 50S ribosomal protein L28 [Candidatus Dadabacteria bacterium]|nr:MAG: 50S ribosomal protein L28 [Candidatus Dadabacteria bacterium]